MPIVESQAKSRRFSLLSMSLLAVLQLAACAPNMPRFGNYGGDQLRERAHSNQLSDPCEGSEAVQLCWFPVQARFHPDGQRLVVNLCSSKRNAQYHCRMVEYHIGQQRWHLIEGQQTDQSYLYPSYSHDGKRLLFSVVDCPQPCRGSGPYGQLATMAVQVRSEAPGVYGPQQPLPVLGASRSSFTRDDQRVVYWRSYADVKRPLGVNPGTISVFEYNRTTGKQTHLIPALYPQTMPERGDYAEFFHPFTAPRYTVDGNTLYFCAMGGNISGKYVMAWNNNCVFYKIAANTFESKVAFRDVRGLGMPYTQTLNGEYLAGAGSLRLVNPTKGTETQIVPPAGLYQQSDADIDTEQTKVSLVVAAIRPSNGSHVAKRSHYLDPEANVPAIPLMQQGRFPMLSLVALPSKTMHALIWPNVEALERQDMVSPSRSVTP